MSKANQGGPAGQGSDSEVVSVLRAARARVERGWCKGDEAITTDGSRVDPASPHAVAWCMAGSLIAEGCTVDDFRIQDKHPAVRLIERVVGTDCYGDWQDEQDRRLSEVLAKFDEAIALASNASAAESRPQEDPQP